MQGLGLVGFRVYRGNGVWESGVGEGLGMLTCGLYNYECLGYSIANTLNPTSGTRSLKLRNFLPSLRRCAMPWDRSSTQAK